MSTDFKDILVNKINETEKIIEKFLPDENNDDMQKEIYEAMNYSILAGGKRLRPLLMLETFRLYSEDEKEIYPFMAAIEMIHTYSLVHDDLPSMDNDDYRRGKLTTHKKYGEAMGVLTGDALLNFAFETVLKNISDTDNLNAKIKALSVLAEKAGIYGMIGGQVRDIKNDGKEIDDATLDKINELKTSALIEASMLCGGIVANAYDADIQLINEIGKDIGRAFQIQDDILDVISDDETLGKPVNSDEKNNKITYVSLLGLDNCKELVEKLSNRAVSNLKKLNKDTEFLEELILYLVDRKY
ncbi:geranylgeranyl diphosphate synthase, type II [Lachnospiraceae bacterium RM5]|nr:geranylgeranyl diphosphate synthase, type II [Lachnospiraceae bacterium RM5]